MALPLVVLRMIHRIMSEAHAFRKTALRLPDHARDNAMAAGSIRLFLVGLPAGLHQIEALLDLAEQQRQILAFLGGKAGEDLLLPAQKARDQLFVQRAALSRQP